MSRTAPFRKAMAMVIAIAMMMGMVPTAFADQELPGLGASGESLGQSEGLGASGVITAFAQLPEDVRFQRGTEPTLPQRAEGTVDGQTVHIPVAWESETDATQLGLHAFVAKPGAGYTIAEDVSAPIISFVHTMLGRIAGLGTETSPLEITNAAQLAEIAALANAGKLEETVLGSSTAQVYLKLMNDIDLSDYGQNYNGGKGWVPIGSEVNGFKGHFDGDGKVVTGLYINDASQNFAGLFGYSSRSSVVKKLGLADVNITGGNYVGGVAGFVSSVGRVENCYTTGSISGNDGVGGIVGVLHGIVETCYSTSSITGNNEVGGVVGNVSGTDAKIENCVALGSNIGANGPRAGRIVGYKSGDLVSGNYAFGGMVVEGSIAIGTATDINGEAKTAGDIIASGTLFGLFTAADGWTAVNGKLPGFGAAVEMPGHINTSGYHFAGVGTYLEPFQISTAAELAKLADIINNDNGNVVYNANTVYYRLTDNIDLSGYGAANTAFNGGKGWMPIGESNQKNFKGNFDGNGKVATGLYINDASCEYVGLFGCISGGGVHNLGLVNVDLTGGNGVGGVAGYAYGTVQKCYVTGSVTGMDNVGGVAGSVINGTVKNCYSTASVTGEYRVGGVVGFVDSGTVENCYSTGSVSGGKYVGGVAGCVDSGTVQNCAALNPFVGKDSASNAIGRIVGVNYGTGNLSGNVAFRGMLVHSNVANGGMVSGNAADEHGEDKIAYQLQTGSGFPAAFTAPPWSCVPGRLPIFMGQAGQDASMPLYLVPPGGNPFDGGGTSSNPYLISAAAQLAWLAQQVNAGDIMYNNNNRHYLLTADIDLTAYGAGWNDGKGWVPIGLDMNSPFKGQFDGNGYTVTGLYINDTGRHNAGLFGCVDTGATVQNLGVINVSISGGDAVGGVAGDVRGGTVQSCYATGSIAGSYNVGGVAGQVLYGGLLKNSYATSSVTGYYNVGGVAGRVIQGSVSYVSEVENCYATGSVTGNNNVGGVAGQVAGSTATNCAALNPSVTATENRAGRIVAYKDSTATVTGNYAYSGMVCQSNGSGYDDGTAMTAADAHTSTFWTTSANWHTSAWDSTVWLIQSGKLPILQDVGGGQDGGSGLYLSTKSLENATVTLSQTTYTYNGAQQTPTATVTLGGTTLTSGNDYTTYLNYPTGAGTASITVTGLGDYTGTATATYTILPKPITIYGVTATSRPYNGTTAVVLSDGDLAGVLPSEMSGVSAVLGNGTIATASAGNGKLVTTSITLSGAKAGNYILTQPTSITVNIAAIELTDITVTGSHKVYDGTAVATATATINSGVISGDDVMVSITGAAFSDQNAGSNKPVAYSWSLTGTDAGSYRLPATKPAVTANITQAIAPPIFPQVVSIYRQMASTGNTVDLSALLPADRGATSYSVTSINSLVTGAAVDPSGVLHFDTSAAPSATTENITINVTMANYDTATITVTVNFTDKKVPVVTATVSGGISYGQPLSALPISASAKVDGGATTVPGSIAWDNSSAKPAVGAGAQGWTFTPADTARYETVTGSSPITVNKAAPSGTPVITSIAQGDKTLADAALTGSFTNPHDGSAVPGALAWDSGDTTAVVANTAYGWTFTPADTANYASRTGSFTPYATGGNGNHGGSSSSRSSSSSGNSGKAAASVSATVIVDAPKAKAALSAMKSGDTRARIAHTGSIKVVAEAWKVLGKTPVMFDTTADKAVQVRITVSAPDQMRGEMLLSGFVKGTAVDSRKASFTKWFGNKVQVIRFEQSGAWGQPVEIAAKVDLAGMDAENLVLYSYDKATNTYKRIANPGAWVDKNGYLHFTTDYAGDIVISDGALVRK